MDKEVVEKKPKMKPRGKNIGETLAPQTEPGDTQKYIGVSLQLFKMNKVDLHNPDAVQDRLAEYFQIHFDADVKPTVAGMAMALGMDRRRLWEVKVGVTDRNQDLPTLTRDYIKKAYDFVENLMENYMQNGKINPVSGIFLMKNNFGYVDKQEHVVTPNVQSDSDYSADDIKKRYLTDSPTFEQLSDGSDS